MLILHGEDQVSSRQMLTFEKEKAAKDGCQIVNFFGGDLVHSDLATATESVSLLGSVNKVFIEDLFSRRPSNEKKVIIKYLSEHPQADIVVWESKDVSTQLKDFSPQVIRKFDLPKYIFQFLDTLDINSFQQALKTSSPEQIFALLVSQIRKLIMVKDNSGNFPSWQQTKLKSISAKFSLPKLLSAYQDLLQIDYAQKNSLQAYDLSLAIELWLLKL